MGDFYDFQVNSLAGKPDLLGSLRGKVTLAVNVASKCGLTPQYSGLEQLQEQFKERGFNVVGFPCNQFGSQEPGTEQQIAAFCSATYGVTFPMSAKLDVNGAARHPLYAWLTSKENGHPGNIGWNFEKFLIGRDGQVIQRYSPRTPPEDAQLRADLAQALGA